MDITKLEGYREDMTAEEKLELLKGYEPPAPDYTGYVKKELFDRTAAEVADWKRKHNALLSEEERREAERAAKAQEIENELNELRKSKSISDNKSQYLALGYDEQLAGETAKAFADGDMEKVFANQKAFVETLKKAERAAALADMKDPPAGDPPKGVTCKKDFDALSSDKQIEFMKKNASWREIIAK